MKPNFLISSLIYNNDRITHIDKIQKPLCFDDVGFDSGLVEYEDGLRHETLSISLELVSSGNTSEIPTSEVVVKLMQYLSKFEL